MEACVTRFTPAEGGARLAATVGNQNTLVVQYSGFIPIRGLLQHAYKIRGLLSQGKQRSAYVTRAARVKCVSYELRILTDLSVAEALVADDVEDWRDEVESKEVIVCTSVVLKHILEERILTMDNLNFLIIDSCHLIYKDDNLKYIMKLYKSNEEDKRPRILALTYPLFTSIKKESDQPDPRPNQTIGDMKKSIEKNKAKTKDTTDEEKEKSITENCEKIDSKAENDGKSEDSPRQDDEKPDQQTETSTPQEIEKEIEIGACENCDDFDMYEKLEWKMEELERELCCKMDLAEDVDGGKRLQATTKPKELIIEFSAEPVDVKLSDEYRDLEKFMRDTIDDAMKFLDDHRYDPTEIYGDELYEEFMSIPNPTVEPKYILKQFIYVLDQLGPYGADKAAFTLLTKLEKLKIKVPYERHFLLFCLCTTVLVKIRCHADYVFSKYETDWEKIQAFCTPKVLRFAEILAKFQPPGNTEHGRNVEADSRNKDGDGRNGSLANKEKMLEDIEKCDFLTLKNQIEEKVNAFEGELGENGMKEKTEKAIDDGKDGKIIPGRNPLGYHRKGGHRPRGRGRMLRGQNYRLQQLQLNPDALCGIVFVKEALMSKILFLIVADMSRSHPCLQWVVAQYCGVEFADWKQGRQHEDVLKKFRMHECNLLLATSALEEGIDLPRCNLVLRWDIPPSYRSYDLCRGRARAGRACCALLSSGASNQTDTLVQHVSVYKELDQIISRKCGCGAQDEPPQSEEEHADRFTHLVEPYTPVNVTTADQSVNCQASPAKSSGDDKTVESDSEAFDRWQPSPVNVNVKVTDVNRDRFDSCKENNDRNKSKEANNYNDVIEMKYDKKTDDKNDNDNLVCNKCNNMKNNVNIECVCVDRNVICDSAETKCDKEMKNDNRFDSESASVDLSNAIALINRYCAKLPSDTFTRLAPQWWIEKVQLPAGGQTKDAYICTLRLPLNCPLKYNIVGHPMPTRVLARRMAALQACRILHKTGELDNQLMPIGKENFKAVELDNSLNCDSSDAGDSARPGTTKRRQYYYKRTASAFTDCQPVIDATDEEIKSEYNPNDRKDDDTDGSRRNSLFTIGCMLWCALPERYNTRGRRLHAPQHAAQAIALLLHADTRTQLKIPSFPVYTRSGEVRVSLEKVPDADVRLSPTRDRLIRRFMRFVFAEVLRVRRRGMRLQSEGSTHNNYYIVPTIKSLRDDGTTKISIDWTFLEQIYRHTEEQKLSEIEKPVLWPRGDDDDDDENDDEVKKDNQEKKPQKRMSNPLLKEGEVFVFDAEKYKEAVVTPWYRNQDQPQFFLVAEICWNLTPDSLFPSDTHSSFRHYYSSKYNVELTQSQQPLLDVDHTSARLNLLTPRYVNRKGVALPVSSERTRRAKRDRLDQKQILVPELCTVHPFAAPLWFAIVALPCVLYRINALLIADEIRRSVAIGVGLGISSIDESTGFQWPPLHFGWSLAEVLNADSDKKKDDEEESKKEKEDQSQEEIDKDKNELEGDENSPKEKTINDILQEKEATDGTFEIGMWSNDMARSIPQTVDYDELMDPLPPNLTFCSSASGGTNWCDPVDKPKNQFNPSRTFSMADSDCSYMSSDFDTDDSEANSADSDADTDMSGFCSSKNSNAAMGVRIEYKTAHEAEAVDVQATRNVKPAPTIDLEDQHEDWMEFVEVIRSGTAPDSHIEKFRKSVEEHKKEIIDKHNLIKKDENIIELLPETVEKSKNEKICSETEKTRLVSEIFPYGDGLNKHLQKGKINLEKIEKNKRILLESLKKNMKKPEINKLNCFSMIDVDIDSPGYVNEKLLNVGFDNKEKYVDKVKNALASMEEFKPYYQDGKVQNDKEFDFDFQPKLEGHPGPSPSVILQALTMSNANDGINLERLETIGDSFLKFAITAYLYCAHPTVHEGKLSHMRSKQVSNLNLYRLGRNKRLGARMIASKFEPHDNWLPPCHKPPSTLHSKQMEEKPNPDGPVDNTGVFIPYNLITQHSIPDKSIADCVEALIGAYLLECGPRGALLLMSWLGIKVLPLHLVPIDPELNLVDAKQETPQPRSTTKRDHSTSSSTSSSRSCSFTSMPWSLEEESGAEWTWRSRPPGTKTPYLHNNGQCMLPIYGELKAPPSPLLRYIQDPEGELERMLSGYDSLERTLQYRFRDRSLLLQALTHASQQHAPLTDCYQRLEFLGDAILDYLITRHLYEDPRRHSPGALTDLRSALVNNTIFATLAARHGFHKYFRHMSPGLNEVLVKYVKIQEENGHSISEEHYLIQEDELEQAEDVEVPKALGDLFESVAGAIFLDSGMSLDAVWKSYVNLMGAELEAFSAAAPKSPVRELLEAEPDTAKFGKPERLADGRRVRVCVEVFGRGAFKGIGRNYRIAKGTAARCALRHLNKYKPRR